MRIRMKGGCVMCLSALTGKAVFGALGGKLDLPNVADFGKGIASGFCLVKSVKKWEGPEV